MRLSELGGFRNSISIVSTLFTKFSCCKLEPQTRIAMQTLKLKVNTSNTVRNHLVLLCVVEDGVFDMSDLIGAAFNKSKADTNPIQLV